MLEAERSEHPAVGDRQGGRHGGGHEAGRRPEELELESVGIGDEAKAAAGLWVARGRELFADGRDVGRFGKCAVMPHADRPAVRRANRDVADLAVRRKVSEQDEVALAAAEILLVQRRRKYALVE